MPIFKHPHANIGGKKSVLMLYLSLLLSALCIIWLSQNSINTYWQQTYHNDSPIMTLNRFAFWRMGGKLQHSAYNAYAQTKKRITGIDQQIITSAQKISALQQIDSTPLTLPNINSNYTTSAENKTNVEVNGQEESVKDRKHASLIIHTRDITPPQTVSVSSTKKQNKPTKQLVAIVEDDTPSTLAQENKIEKSMTINSNSDNDENGKEVKHTPLIIGARDFTQSQVVIASSATRQEKNTEPSNSPTETNKPENTKQRTAQVIKSTPKPENTHKTEVSLAEVQPIDRENKKSLVDGITLQPGDKILFAGDSLMQGVAPHVQKWLQHNHNIKSLNLSKQSTGLSYPDFFDWPATIENAIGRDPSIRAVVIFLGPNDPWDFPNPQNRNAPYLKFKTQEWENVYRERINRILSSTAQHNVAVIWLGIPFMKDSQLNEKMNYLDTILRDMVQNSAIFVPTKYILTDGNPNYVDTIVLNGKPVRMRSKDGTHFTISGQKQLATAIQRRFFFPPNN